MMFDTMQPIQGEDKWRRKLNEFVKANQQELAALAWGLFVKRGKTDETLGIDLDPKPHFIYCPKPAIEELNRQVDNRLQEVLGIVDAHNPEVEVLMIGIGKGQLKLVQFEPETPPPLCFEQVATDVDTLLDLLEEKMCQQIDYSN